MQSNNPTWTPDRKLSPTLNTRRIITLDPQDELIFTPLKDNTGSLKAALTITNNAKGNLAYKVKTTAPRHYVVKPNQGVLESGGKITVDITLIASPVSILTCIKV